MHLSVLGKNLTITTLDVACSFLEHRDRLQFYLNMYRTWTETYIALGGARGQSSLALIPAPVWVGVRCWPVSQLLWKNCVLPLIILMFVLLQGCQLFQIPQQLSLNTLLNEVKSYVFSYCCKNKTRLVSEGQSCFIDVFFPPLGWAEIWRGEKYQQQVTTNKKK